MSKRDVLQNVTKHIKMHKKLYGGTIIIGILLCVLPTRGIFAYYVLHYELWKMDVKDAYTINEIRYTSSKEFDHAGYTMELVGQKEDDKFYITWDQDGIYNSYQEAIIGKENTIRRLKANYQEEVTKTIISYLSPEESVAFDFGGREGDAWMQQHAVQNMSYHKDFFKGLTQHIGIHFTNRYAYEDIVNAMVQIQTTLDTLGYELTIYNITIDRNNERFEFSNLAKEDLHTSLTTRLQDIVNGVQDTSIQYVSSTY